MYLFELG